MSVERSGQAIGVEALKGQLVTAGTRGFDGGRQPFNDGTSRMNREVQVRICEGLGVKFPGPTRRAGVLTPAYSYRIALSGFSTAALRAGIQQANNPTAVSSRLTVTNIIGSDPETCMGRVAMRRAAANAAASPNTMPAINCFIPRVRTSPRMLPEVAPNAMRTPISWVRLLVACAMTA